MESPIEAIQAANEVTEDLIVKRKGRPPKAKSETEGSEVVKAMQNISEALNVMSSKLSDVTQRIERIEQTAEYQPVSRETDEPTVPAEPGKEDVTVLAVKKILGQGDPASCQFSISIEPEGNGRNFALVMIPPVHLREIPDEITKDGRRIVMDRRVKVLSYNEGVSGAEQYAKKVYAKCVGYANQNAIAYFEK